MGSQSGQALVETVLTIFIFIATVSAGSALLWTTWDRTTCLYHAFDQTHSKLHGHFMAHKQFSGWLKRQTHIQFTENDQSLTGKAHCGVNMKEQVVFRKLEHVEWD